MIYGSVCSGIESASVAWHDLPGWKPAFFSEIDPFARAVLQHRFPDVPLHGDFTNIQEGDYAPIDLLVGGTPCQSFSVAGLRGGMNDARGNLTLEFVRLARRLKPRYILWENVPGVLSSNGGRDFGSLLGALVELGYGVAYRVLDAQFFGVPQRRRRVFVVGYFGDNGERASEILFDGDGVCRHSHQSRTTGKNVAALTATGVGTCGTDDNQAQAGHLIAHALRGEGFDASEDGTGRSTPLVPVYMAPVAPTLPARATAGGGMGTDFDCDGGLVAYQGRETNLGPTLYRTNAKGQVNAQGDISSALTTSTDPCAQILAFDTTQITSAENRSNPQPGDPCHPVAAQGHVPTIAFSLRGRDGESQIKAEIGEVAPALRAVGGGSSHAFASREMAVRRLTPVECERLQGFPDSWTAVPYRGKAAADGPRYKAIGNSMAVNVMAWIGKRIQQAELAA